MVVPQGWPVRDGNMNGYATGCVPLHTMRTAIYFQEIFMRISTSVVSVVSAAAVVVGLWVPVGAQAAGMAHKYPPPRPAVTEVPAAAPAPAPARAEGPAAAPGADAASGTGNGVAGTAVQAEGKAGDSGPGILTKVGDSIGEMFGKVSGSIGAALTATADKVGNTEFRIVTKYEPLTPKEDAKFLPNIKEGRGAR